MDLAQPGLRGLPLGVLVLLAALIGGALAGCIREPEPRIVWLEDGVELSGLSASQLDDPQTETRFTVHTVEGLDGGYPALAGSYHRTADALIFTPAFALAPGQSYVARWLGARKMLQAVRVLPANEPEPRARVEALYPSDPALPANVLRLYLHFSHPMSSGEASRHVRLLRLDGEEAHEVEAPFVAPEHELWDGEHRRLTLLFDPGRIKQGVGPNEELGPVLVPGAHYRLEIDPEWHDARGASLAEGYAHSFTATVPDRNPPDPESWKITPPTGPYVPLEITFPAPLDHALLHRCLEVRSASGEVLAGEIEIPSGERGWRFHPHGRWHPGSYRVRVAPILEDPSGNRLGRAFDAPIDSEDGIPAPPPEPKELEFRVRPPP